MNTLRTCLVVAAAAATVALHGQQPATPSKPVFRSGVDLVEVDVSVLDKDRFPIRDLTAQHFTLLEDGQPRPIVSFTSVDLPEAEAAIAPAFRGAVHDVVSNEVPQEGRLVVILMDRTIGMLQQRDARTIAAGIIDQLGPGDLGAVTYSSGFTTDSKYPQNFTTDHARLLAAVEHPQFGMTSPPEMTAGGLVEGGGPPSGEDYCQPRTLNAIANIAEALRDVPHRRKMLVIVASNMEFQATRPECWLIVKMARERAFHALEVANVTIDVIDPTGVEYVLPRNRSSNLQRQDNLRLLPARTGGQYQSSNRPEEHLAILFQASRSYYLLAFQPANPKADGRFHKIEVKVNRAGAHVHARQGYDAPPAAATPATAAVNATPLFAALAAAVPTSGIPLNICAVAIAVPGRTDPAVTITVGIRASAEITGTTFDVMTAAFDSRSRQVASVRQRADLNGPLSSTGPLDVLSRLDLRPGLYEIRAAVAEVDGSHTGSVYTYVEVPAFDQDPLVLSGVALEVLPAWPATPVQAVAGLLPFAPTTKRTFGARDRVTALLRVHQGNDHPEAVLMTARVTDQLGRHVISDQTTLGAERFQGPTGVDYRLTFPVAQFARGDYLLTVEAAIGKRTVHRDLRFTVQ